MKSFCVTGNYQRRAKKLLCKHYFGCCLQRNQSNAGIHRFERLNLFMFTLFIHLCFGFFVVVFNDCKAAKYLYIALEGSGDPKHAFNGLLQCVPNTELPDVCRQYLQRVP